MSSSLARSVLPQMYRFKSIVTMLIFRATRERYVLLIDEFNTITEIFINQLNLLGKQNDKF